MILQDQGLLERMRLIFGWLLSRWPFDLGVVLNQNSIVQHGDGARLQHLPLVIETRGMKDNVIGLPFPGLAGDVDKGRILTVHGAGLTVEVGLVLIGVQDLEFVASLNDNAAVAATLTFADDYRRRRPIDMQLAIAERLLRDDAAGPVDRGHAVLHLPRGPAPALASPLRQVSAIKKHNRVRGRRSGVDDARLVFCPNSWSTADKEPNHQGGQKRRSQIHGNPIIKNRGPGK